MFCGMFSRLTAYQACQQWCLPLACPSSAPSRLLTLCSCLDFPGCRWEVNPKSMLQKDPSGTSWLSLSSVWQSVDKLESSSMKSTQCTLSVEQSLILYYGLASILFSFIFMEHRCSHCPLILSKCECSTCQTLSTTNIRTTSPELVFKEVMIQEAFFGYGTETKA